MHLESDNPGTAESRGLMCGWSRGMPQRPSLNAAVSEINLLFSEISFLILACARKLNCRYL